MSAGSWTILALVIVGFLATIPGIEHAFTSAAEGSALYILGKVIAGLVGVAFVAAWIGGIVHAATSSDFRSEGQKVLVICFLVVGNAVAGFFYFFGSVVWRASPRTSGT